MKFIDFENHFYTKECVEYLKKRKKCPRFFYDKKSESQILEFTEGVYMLHSEQIIDSLTDIDEGRIKVLDGNNVDMQILSMSVPSGIECKDNPDAISLMKDANDQLHETIKKHPTRFKGFTALYPYDAKAAVKELERTKEMGFVGWLTHSNFGPDMYLDDKEYWPIIEAAAALDMPIYLHPTVPEIKSFKKYGFATAGNALGFQFDTALCFMRMVLGGVFEKFPNLKVILGHLGETLPFLIERLDYEFKHPQMAYDRPNLSKVPGQVLKENTYITTSGRFHEKVLKFAIDIMGEDKVLFASDYPYESLPETMHFIQTAGLSESVLEKVCYKNAEKLGIKI